LIILDVFCTLFSSLVTALPQHRPYPVTKEYKNGTIQIQKEIVSERVKVSQIC
jgi:hypothetical protein